MATRSWPSTSAWACWPKGDFLQIFSLGAAQRGAFGFALLGDLHGDLRLDEARLLIGGGARLLGLDALLLGFGFAHDRPGPIDRRAARRRRADQDFRRNRGFAKTDFADLDAGLSRFPLDLTSSIVSSIASRFSMRSSTRVGRTS